jgi:hypothetical protein
MLVVLVLAHADLSVTEVEGHTVDLHEDLSLLRFGKRSLFEAYVVESGLLGEPLLDLLWRHDWYVSERSRGGECSWGYCIRDWR